MMFCKSVAFIHLQEYPGGPKHTISKLKIALGEHLFHYLLDYHVDWNYENIF